MGWFRRRNESNETREDQRNADIPPPLMAMLDSVQGMDRKPPVTLVLMGVMYLLHVQVARTPSMLLPFALCPEKVMAKKQIGAMFVAPFIHAEEMYLYQSMLSLMWKGYKLEGRLGSVGFCVLLLYLIALTQALIVLGAHLISWSAMRECFTGFSGVLTAMKVILNVNSPTFTKLYSFKVPTKYAAWLELFITYLLVPKLPLLAQAAGLLAGYIYVVIPNADALVGHAAYYVQQLLIKLGLARKPFQWWQFWPKFIESMRKRRRRRAARQE